MNQNPPQTNTHSPSSGSLILDMVLRVEGDQQEAFLQHGMTIGRAASNTICVDSPDVEQIHARVLRGGDGKLYLRTETLTGHIALPDGSLVQQIMLTDHTRFQIGKAEMYCTRQSARQSSEVIADGGPVRPDAQEFSPVEVEAIVSWSKEEESRQETPPTKPTTTVPNGIRPTNMTVAKSATGQAVEKIRKREIRSLLLTIGILAVVVTIIIAILTPTIQVSLEKGLFPHASTGVIYTITKAIKGSAPNMVALGNLYENGLDTPRNPTKAFEWYKKAADLDHPEGYYHLGICYETGMGTKADIKLAFDNIEKSAEFDLPQGLYKLATFYLTGTGTKMNPAWGKELLQRAANAGSLLAARDLMTLNQTGNSAK